MMDQYKCRVFSDETLCKGPDDVQWEFSSGLEAWKPDVITINLGTNDYSFGTPSKSAFQQSYQELVAFVRSVNPDALIFCICPLMYSLEDSEDCRHMQEGVEGAVKALNDDKVLYIATGDVDAPWMNGASDFSDWTHPTIDGHNKFAKRLYDLLTPHIDKHFEGLSE